MRSRLLALALLAAPTLFAQTADMKITVATFGAPPTHTGERVSLSTRWQNDGPNAAHFVNVRITGAPTPFFLLSHATGGWPCAANPEGNFFRCQNAMLASGDEAGLVVQMLAPTTPGSFVIRIEVTAEEQDPNPANNVATIPMEIAASPETDLSISPGAQLSRAAGDAEVSLPVVIANEGANALHNLSAYFAVPVTENIREMSASGEGWDCNHPPFARQAVLCNSITLAAGAIAPIVLTTTAPPDGASSTIHLRVGAEAHSDPTESNNHAVLTVTSALEVDPPEQTQYTRVLLPLTAPATPGVNGALWRTEITGFLDANEPFDLFPGTGTPAMRAPFDVIDSGLHVSDTAQFIYVPKETASTLHLNARVFDESRFAETAGSEIPIAREDEFTSEPISLLGIPVASHYRHTLRVYELAGTEGGRVRVRLFANSEAAPRIESVQTLHRVEPIATTPFDAPETPAMLILDPAQLLPLAGITTLRVDIEPVDPGLKLWSFVSVTNNNTHHVTTFSAQ